MSKDKIADLHQRNTKSALPIHPVSWSSAMVKDLYENWYRVFSDSPCNIVIFENFFFGKKSQFSFDFKQEHNDATLIRIGCILGLDMEKQRNVFAAYRRRYARSSTLNSNLCPKNKATFLKSIEIVDALRKLLARHGHFYIYPLQSDEDCFNDYTNHLNDIDCELDEKNAVRSLLDKQVEDLNRHRQALLAQRDRRFATKNKTEE